MFSFRLNAVLITLALGVFAASPAAAAAKPTNTAEYQILATTMGGMQGMMMPFMLQLDARGAPAPGGEHQGRHVIPAGMKMGKELPLVRPERRSAGPVEVHPGNQENWTVKIYWGCSKEVQKGQPIILSPQEMKSGKGQIATLAGGRDVWKGEPPAGWGWGQWPNKKSGIPVPAGASLKGDHLVTGNYLPDMKFNIARHDFLPPLTAKTDGDPNGVIALSWQPVQGAVGYFAFATAANQARKETIIWTSSSKASMGMATHEHSSHVKKLIAQGIVMDANKAACNIPAGIFAEAEGVSVIICAWGEDYRMSYPPKPANAPKGWKPDWTVDALFLSQWMGIPGMSEELEETDQPSDEAEQADSEPESSKKSQPNGKATVIPPNININIPFPPVRF